MAETFTKESADETAKVLRSLGVEPINDASPGLTRTTSIPSVSGSSSVSSSSGNAGSSGGSGNSAPGGTTPPGNSSPTGGNSNIGGSKKVEKKILLFALIAVAFASLMGALSVMYIGVKSTTPEGIARANSLAQLEDKKDERRHLEAMKKLELRERRSVATSDRPAPASETLAPVVTQTSTMSCETLTSGVAGRLDNPIRLEPGKCYVRDVPSNPEQDGMWISFAQSPKGADAAGSYRLDELKEADDGSHRVTLLSYCEATSADSQCVSYASTKTNTTLWFRNRGRVQFQM